MNSKIEHPVLPWHRKAAKEITSYYSPSKYAQNLDTPEVATIIARHDQHATTLRLLERADEVLADVSRYPKAGPYPDGPCLERGTHDDVCALLHEIRAHLAATKGTS